MKLLKLQMRLSRVSDALNNPIITKLRSQYLELANREADWSKRYGRDHLAVVNLRNQLEEIRRSTVDELKRIAETYKSNYAIAKRNQEDLEKRLAESVTELQATNQAQVLLRGLESSAQSYRTAYDNFLQHYTESIQQQSFPTTEARLISPATSPLEKSRPKTLRVLALALLGGIGCGAGLALLRELLDRVFRTNRQIQSALDAECLALVPSTQVPMIKAGAKAAPVSVRAATDLVVSRIIAPNPSLLRYVVDSPLSSFAESIRAIKVSIDLSGAAKSNKVIGITSALPNEGKSTIAASLAQLSADGGARVILVDCDLRKPSLSQGLAPKAAPGLIDVIAGTASLDNVIWSDPSTRLSFLPVGTRSRLIHTSEILASDAMKRLFVRLRESYDYVIVDLSPIFPVVDVRSATHLLDSYVFVIEWGKTKIHLVEPPSMLPAASTIIFWVLFSTRWTSKRSVATNAIAITITIATTPVTATLIDAGARERASQEERRFRRRAHRPLMGSRHAGQRPTVPATFAGRRPYEPAGRRSRCGPSPPKRSLSRGVLRNFLAGVPFSLSPRQAGERNYADDPHQRS